MIAALKILDFELRMDCVKCGKPRRREDETVRECIWIQFRCDDKFHDSGNGVHMKRSASKTEQFTHWR